MKHLFLLTLLILSGCASLSEEGSKVRLTSNTELPKMSKCQKIDAITGSSEGPGEMGKTGVPHALRDRAATLGGNVVVSSLDYKQVFGFASNRWEGKGVVFKCPEALVSSLIDMTQF